MVLRGKLEINQRAEFVDCANYCENDRFPFRPFESGIALKSAFTQAEEVSRLGNG